MLVQNIDSIQFSKQKDYWELEYEKIAFTHKIYRQNVLKVIRNIVLNIGGKIENKEQKDRELE